MFICHHPALCVWMWEYQSLFMWSGLVFPSRTPVSLQQCLEWSSGPLMACPLPRLGGCRVRKKTSPDDERWRALLFSPLLWLKERRRNQIISTITVVGFIYLLACKTLEKTSPLIIIKVIRSGPMFQKPPTQWCMWSVFFSQITRIFTIERGLPWCGFRSEGSFMQTDGIFTP